MKSRLFLRAASKLVTSQRIFASTKTVGGAGVKVFDRGVKLQQREWAAAQDEFDVVQYVKEEIGYRVADKIYDLTQFSPVCLDIGCGAGHIAPHVFKENVGCLIQADMSASLVGRSNVSEEVPTLKVVCDEELVPFRANSIDLIVSSLSAHWINDLPTWFRRCYEVLRPDSVMIGAMFSGDTLFELRCSLQLAEIERLGGVGSHISPFAQVQDIGSLMNRAGFDMITLDSDELVVGYPDMFALMYDLQGMGESSAAHRRSPHLRRDVLIAADAIYKEMYGKEGSCSASFQTLSFIGWKPGPKMPKPAKRGSQTASFKDMTKLSENPPPI
uniref:Arginine-hydroxylase NDUFAF5, mitochondrial n=1 Tax=Plectus sambesii TaxID=2011161 RepID=A0A914UKS4_9BILA